MNQSKMHPLLLLGTATVLASSNPSWLFADALPQYADRIPNGYNVPNPGPQGGVWAGVGHENAGGGGPRNPFGLDFISSGNVWTEALCQTDSDGDGRSNGVELGDPECAWFEGGPEPAGPALSHPGIVDEAKSEATRTFCDTYEEPSNIELVNVTFSVPNDVNETLTHYICEQREIQVPSSTTSINPNANSNGSANAYHLVKSSVILDNPDLLHHIFVFVCPANVTSTDGNRVGQGSYNCMGASTEANCHRVASWAIGPHDKCMPNNVGTRIDLPAGTDSMVVKIEAHYNNAMAIPQQDKSGIQLTLTPDLRPLQAGSIILGMVKDDNNFQIPAQSVDHVLTNTCPSEATSLLTHPIYIYQFAPHMHLYGKTLYTEQWRCGKKIREIGRIEGYEFDNQQFYGILDPIKLLPGDALVTKCQFNTEGQNSTIYGGAETEDEMCLDFLQYYPDAEKLSVCLSVLNGFRSELPRLQDLRVALTRADVQGAIFQFDEDPANSWAPCCDAMDCDSQFLAAAGGACGNDADCEGPLACRQGLCEEADPTGTILPPTDSPTTATTADTSAASAADSFKFFRDSLLCAALSMPLLII